MKITIKQVQGILLSNILIVGLTACSSSPSPWSQMDDSPWKAKRDADASSVAAEEFVAVPLEEPVMPEPVPVMEEPMPMEEPAPMPEPVMAEPVPVGIMAMSADGFAVQVYAGNTQESVMRYQSAHALENLMVVNTARNGETVYVLVDVYASRAAANQAAADLQQKTGSKPWVRSVAGLQKIAIE